MCIPNKTKTGAAARPQINELPEDEKANFIGKMHSPEMQEKIQKTFTSEAFQDHIDKMEAEKGIERRGSWHASTVASTPPPLESFFFFFHL